MKVERHAEELGVEREGKAQVSVNLVCNTSVNQLASQHRNAAKVEMGGALEFWRLDVV